MHTQQKRHIITQSMPLHVTIACAQHRSMVNVCRAGGLELRVCSHAAPRALLAEPGLHTLTMVAAAMPRAPGIREGRLWARAVLQAWLLVTTQTQLAAMEAENKHLRDKLGKQASNIWLMRKTELVELAVDELRIPRERAEKMLVAELRERIRAAREPLGPEDPLSVRPPNLSRMTKEQLQVECDKRGLPYLEYPDGKETYLTRGAMLVLIGDDIETRKAAQKATTSDEEIQTGSPETDWYRMDADDMETETTSAASTKRTGSSLPTVPRFPKAKPKGKGRGRG